MLGHLFDFGDGGFNLTAPSGWTNIGGTSVGTALYYAAVNGDGCSSVCQPEPGYVCGGGNPSICQPLFTMLGMEGGWYFA